MKLLLSTGGVPYDSGREDRTVVDNLASTLAPEACRIPLFAFLNPKDEKMTTGQLTDELLAEEVLEERLNDMDGDEPP